MTFTVDSTTDELLSVDSKKLMEQMDKVKPHWEVEVADQQALAVFASEVINGLKPEDARRRLRDRGVIKLKNNVWLMGHAALGVKE
jgi:hypothetical protein